MTPQERAGLIHAPSCKCDNDTAHDIIVDGIATQIEAAERGAKEKLHSVLDFCKGAIEDAIYTEDGLDGSAGQSVIEMIDKAQKGLASGCQHCLLQYAEGFRDGQAETVKVYDNRCIEHSETEFRRGFRAGQEKERQNIIHASYSEEERKQIELVGFNAAREKFKTVEISCRQLLRVIERITFVTEENQTPILRLLRMRGVKLARRIQDMKP